MKFRNISYLLSLCPALVAIFGNTTGGWWSCSNLFFSLFFLAIAELLLGDNTDNSHSHAKDPFPAYILYAHVYAHTALWVSLIYGITTGVLSGQFVYCAAISSGVAAGGGGIVVGHELIHKASAIKQLLGKYLLLSSGNFYFFVHHLRIHHRLVGTSKDAATAKYGESLYQFYLRTMYNQIVDSWADEKRRLAKLGFSAFSWRNEIAFNLCLILIFLFSIWIFAGGIVLIAFVLFFTVANLLLEYVNYIEHYGLKRAESERVNEFHSWNSDKIVSRFLLVDLSRHADHHNHPSKPYHNLHSFPNSPNLPGGYASMIVPALIPPLWRRIVHPILDSMDKNKTSD